MSNDPPKKPGGNTTGPSIGVVGGGSTKYSDIYKFGKKKNSKGKIVYIGNHPVAGSAELLLGYPAVPEGMGNWPGGFNPKPVKDLTGEESMSAFAQLGNTNEGRYRLLQIQSKMYRAGFYGSDKPDYGHIGDADRKAFREFIISASGDPNRTPASKYLDDSADTGDRTGVNIAKRAPRAPLVIKLTNDDDIRATLQAGAKELHNTYLSDADVQKFINGYHDQERKAQTARYDEGAPDVTGTIDGGLGGEYTDAAQTQSGIAEQEAQLIRPTNQFKANTFTDRLGEVFAALRGDTSPSATQVGPI